MHSSSYRTCLLNSEQPSRVCLAQVQAQFVWSLAVAQLFICRKHKL